MTRSPNDPDVRHLVCENVACNPDLPDYDMTVSRFQMEGSVKSLLRGHIAFMTERLTHTPHIPASQIYDKAAGRMVDRWKCTVCGYSRKY